MDKSIQADLLLPISYLFLCRLHLISDLSGACTGAAHVMRDFALDSGAQT